jgi:hypothetical protein
MYIDNNTVQPVQKHLSIPATKVGIPAEILQLRQWVAWRYGETRPNGKKSKLPINPRTGYRAGTDKPETWASYSAAVEVAKLYGLAGIGFMFSQADSFAGVDLDGCIEGGEIAPWAQNIVDSLDSYAEISPSGCGIKIIAKGSLPTDKTGVHVGKVEMYHYGRYFTITGAALESGKGITESQAALNELYRETVADRDAKAAQKRTAATAATQTPQGARTTTAAGFFGDDKRLLEKASRNQPFPALYYAGDTSGFASQSDADLYLCGALAFWTGKDAERMDRLFRASALYRDKWDRAAYRDSTIEIAISRCRSTYTGQTPTEGRESVVARFQAEREAVDRLPFDWRGGDTDFKLAHALVDTGGLLGSISATGAAAGSAGDYPTVAMAERDFLLAAGIGSNNTVRASLARMIGRELLEVAVPGGKRTATTYRLRFSEASPPSPKVQHNRTTTHRVYYAAVLATERTDVTRMRAQYNPPRKAFDKNGRPTPKHTGDLEKKLSIRSGQAYRHITQNPGAGLEEIATHLEMNTRDGRYKLKKRNLEQLISFELVEERDGGYYPVEGHADRFAEYLENSGCNAAQSRQRDKIERERLAYELYANGQKIVQDFHDEEQPEFPGEHQGNISSETVPEIEDSYSEAPEIEERHTMPDAQATESPRTDAAESPKGTVPAETAEPAHAAFCDCVECSVPTPKYAKGKLLPGDSGRPRIEPRPPIPQDSPNQHDNRKAA